MVNETKETMMDITTKLRAVCGHDSRSVDGCVNCEAADDIERLRQHAVVLANTVHEGARELIEECRAAFHIELTDGWDIDPPLHHVKQAHDRCSAWLSA